MKPNLDEALRYLGVQHPDQTIRSRAAALSQQLTAAITPRNVWRLFALAPSSSGFLLEGTDILLSGVTVRHMLGTCSYCAVLICTLGTSFDTMLRQQQARDIADAVILDACGSAYVESACTQAEQEIASAMPGYYLTDRFSPGYGDLPLELQPQLLAVTDASRRVGVTLLPSSLMNPSKSVTAFIGLSDQPQQARIRGCAHCSMADRCTLRKRGETCEA